MYKIYPQWGNTEHQNWETYSNDVTKGFLQRVLDEIGRFCAAHAARRRPPPPAAARPNNSQTTKLAETQKLAFRVSESRAGRAAGVGRPD
ncbi:hypothetical protein EVAR_23035_1 [Eumeta japonica]|uniref:Uncharacterized protein n=1 Tax=Eumeta variegata TaxID=151549 RepID=A0A4C1UQS2_EUMVA|nr:hypothetical protein EVAR_23035_1 [Eumeta japonica]